MKKIISTILAIAMIGTMAGTAFAAKKTDDQKKNSTTITAKKEKKVKKAEPKVKKPTIKKTKKLKAGFVRISGTTTAKAKIRILVNKKTVAAGQAKKDGSFAIKVKEKKIKDGYTIYAYTKIKGKIVKSEKRKVEVTVENVTEDKVEPTAEPVVEATTAPEVVL